MVSSLQDTAYFPALHLRYASEMRTLSVQPENKRLTVKPLLHQLLFFRSFSGHSLR